MRSWGLVRLGLAVGLLSACGEQLANPVEPDGGTTTPDGGGPPPNDGGKADATSEDDGGAPTTPRIPTVAAGAAIRITPTEVTQLQYKAFLDDVTGKPVAQPNECSWNTTFAPGAGADCTLDEKTTPNRPVRCVDWCDAYAYCAWAGLRLCGKISGGPNPFDAYKDPGSSQWVAACGGSGNAPYPYGGSLNQSACAFSLGSAGPPKDVSETKACEGGYPGLYDMLGNIGEWEDSCASATGAADQCRIRGGYYSYNADQITCGTGDAYERDQKSPKFGIRCCSK